MKPYILLMAALSALFVPAGARAGCGHLYHRPHHVQHYAVQQTVLFSVGDALTIEAAVEKVLAKRQALQQNTAPQSAISQKCTRCHSGENAKGGIDFTTAIDATIFRRSVELLGTGKDAPPAMKGVLSALTPAEKGSLTEELLNLSARPAAAKPEPQALPPEPEAGVLR